MDESETKSSVNLPSETEPEIVQISKSGFSKKSLVAIVFGLIAVMVTLFVVFKLGGGNDSDPSSASQLPLNNICRSVDANSMFTTTNTDGVDSKFVINGGDVIKSNSESIFARLISKEPFIIEYLDLYFDENDEPNNYSNKSFYLRSGYKIDEKSLGFVNKLPNNSVFQAKVGTQNEDFDDYGVELSSGLRAPSRVLYDVRSANLSDVARDNPQIKTEDNISAFLMEFRDDSLGFKRSIEVAQNGFVIYTADGIDGEVTTFLKEDELKSLSGILAKSSLFPNTENTGSPYSSFQVACNHYYEYAGSGTNVSSELKTFLAELGERLEIDMDKQFQFLTAERVYEWTYSDVFELKPNYYYETSNNEQYQAILKRMSEDEKSTFPAGSGGLTYVYNGTYYHVSSYSPDNNPYFRATDFTRINESKNIIVVEMPKDIANLDVGSSIINISDELYDARRDFFNATRNVNTSNSENYSYYLLDGNIYSLPKIVLTHSSSHIE